MPEDHPAADAAIERAARAAWRAHVGPDVDLDALLEGLTAGTLAAAFHETAAVRAGEAALAIEGETVTHGELDDRAARAAGWLRSRGVEPGARILLCAPNSVSFVVAYLAALRVGATAVPAGASLTEPELAAIAARADLALAFADGPALASLRSIAAAAGGWDVVGLAANDGPTLTEAVETGEPVEPVDVPGSATALLAFTSGTTGRPKGVPLSHANLLSSIRAAMAAWRWSPDDALVHALPLSHQHGLGGVHATLLAGSRATILAAFEPATLAAGVAEARATILFAVPAIYLRLVEGDVSRDAFASLRLAISGSAPLSPALFGRVAELLGKPPLERYGTTESGLDVGNPYDGPSKPGSVGLAFPGVTLATVGPDGAPVSPGADGEVVFRGPQVFAGYLDDEDAEDAFFPGGWFRTGDIGRVDPSDGFLTITGRIKEVIISGGLNVHPREVELALEAHPSVGAAAVIGVSSERWGEEVVAFVVPSTRGEPDPDELMAHANERLAGYKCPKRVLVIDELPVTEMGKLDRDRLVQLAG